MSVQHSISVLLTVIRNSTRHTNLIFAFSLQQCLRARAIMLRHSALPILLDLEACFPSLSLHGHKLITA